MFDYMYFQNVAGEIMYWNEDPVDSGYFAVEHITFEPDIRTNERPRMQGQGIWPAYTYFGKMLIHIEGHIVAGSSAAFNAYKLRLMHMVMPLDMGYQFQRHVGLFVCQFTGQSEPFGAEVSPDAAPSIANDANFPSVGECSLTLKSFYPYMVGQQSGNQIWVA
jgi:hypothetical protein